MADVIFKSGETADRPHGRTGRLIAEPLSVDDRPEITFVELLFFAYRDFTSDPDTVLAAYGFGRAHHRVIHFVNRHPGIRVADLLDILNITKQSLGRVLKQLIDGGFIEQVQGPQDRRQRLLYPTESGRALALRLMAPQERRLATALESLTPEERKGAELFLRQVVDEDDRDMVARLIGQ
ncbi:MAG: MarR family transcriptional regulator [Bauldia sp.]|nr:MarR family transcriptional regulator [Bauldia sp.]